MLIPAIDIKDGACVRLRQGDFSEVSTYFEDPLQAASYWVDKGADRIHVVDLDGALAGEAVNAKKIAQMVKSFPEVRFQVGGGIRSLATIDQYVSSGVHYTIIGSKAVSDFSFLEDACREFFGHIILGIDAKDGYVSTDGWLELSDMTALDLAQESIHTGVSQIIYTDIHRDGMLTGVNIEETLALARAVNIPIIASGGISDLDDFKALYQRFFEEDIALGGVISGKALYEKSLDYVEAMNWLKSIY